MEAAETPDFISVAGRRLFCVHHATVAPTRGEVVLCHPFGEEKKSGHRSLVDLARALAKRGVASLRFDFSGCGDSSGDLDDATIEHWLEDLAAAIADLRARSGAGPPLFLGGLRLGASLAALCAAKRNDVAGLVLWQPVVNGRSAFAADLRRTLIKQMMTDGSSGVTREEILARLESGEGTVDLDGFPFTGALYRGIAAIDLAGPGPAYRGHVQLVQIAHNEKRLPDIGALADFLQAGGVDLTVETIVSPPIWARIENVECPDLIRKTSDWIAARCEASR